MTTASFLSMCTSIFYNAEIPTLVSQIVEHTEINEHVGEIAENRIVEHLFYTISIATNNRTPGIFFNCVNSQTRLIIRDTRVGLHDDVIKWKHFPRYWPFVRGIPQSPVNSTH